MFQTRRLDPPRVQQFEQGAGAAESAQGLEAQGLGRTALCRAPVVLRAQARQRGGQRLAAQYAAEQLRRRQQVLVQRARWMGGGGGGVQGEM
ncbi:MAG: hypothetical protein KGJ64_09685 [Betaproteobacteria bacterium]|nr:hypothetical protein [Betaproteobacteria bacterium]